jgi:hypothetical protein
LLVIDERPYEQIRITFSEDYTDILFPGASVLVVLADILKPDIFEELAGKLDSEGRLSRRLLEQQGFITTFDPRRIVLSIAVPQTFRGTRIHRLSEGEPYGIANAVVELKSESETLYRIADNKGWFEFEELRPGKWTLNINEESLPEYHHMVDKNLVCELKPGECREVSIHVVQKKRHIQIVEEKELPFGRLQTKSGEIRKNGEEIMNHHLPGGIHPILPTAGKEATSGKSEKSTIKSEAFSKLIPNTQNSINTREITEKNRDEKPGNNLHAGESREQVKVEPVKIEKGARQRVWIIMILVFVGVIFFSRAAIRVRGVKSSSTPEAPPDSNKEK